jgi:hypothetical protein
MPSASNNFTETAGIEILHNGISGTQEYPIDIQTRKIITDSSHGTLVPTGRYLYIVDFNNYTDFSNTLLVNISPLYLKGTDFDTNPLRIDMGSNTRLIKDILLAPEYNNSSVKKLFICRSETSSTSHRIIGYEVFGFSPAHYIWR